MTGFEDWLPTLFELTGARKEIPSGIDGISFAPMLLGKKQKPRPFLYRESPGYGGQQCVRVGDWKLVRQKLAVQGNQAAKPTTELYNLANDPCEMNDVAPDHPEIVKKLFAIAAREHRPSKLWPIPTLDSNAR